MILYKYDWVCHTFPVECEAREVSGHLTPETLNRLSGAHEQLANGFKLALDATFFNQPPNQKIRVKWVIETIEDE